MKIVNIGSLNIDKVYKTAHFTQPGETEAAQSLELFCGGKGLNQSVALARAGAEIYHAGKVGRDGAMLIEALKRSGADTSFVEQTDGESGHAVIEVVPSGENRIIIYGGANQEIDKEFADKVLSYFSKGDILILQNEINLTQYIMHRANEIGLKIAFNPSPLDDCIKSYPLELVNIFILNEIEGASLAGIKEGSVSPQKIASALLNNYPDAEVMLTLGSKGSLYYCKGLNIFQPCFKVNAVDTTGAGDTFTGYFLAGLASGLDIKENLKRAAAASAIAVTRQGASPSIPGLEEVETFIKSI